MAFDLDQIRVSSPSPELLQARTDDIVVFDVLQVRPRVNWSPLVQYFQEDEAVCEEEERSVRLNSVKEAVPSCRLCPERRQRPADGKTSLSSRRTTDQCQLQILHPGPWSQSFGRHFHLRR